MKRSPIVINLTSVYFIKLRQGEWKGLVLCPCVEVEEEYDSIVPLVTHVIVRLNFDAGKSKVYSGAIAAAIQEALTETPYIDKSQVGGLTT